MKRFQKYGMIAVLAAMLIPSAAAQSKQGMTLNGAAGLFTVPSGYIGWGRLSDLGIDLGYQAVIADSNGYKSGASHLMRVSFSLFKWVEVSGLFDIQPEPKLFDEKNNDLIIGLKVQLPTKNTAVAIGGNFQSLNLGSDSRNTYGISRGRGSYTAFQLYVAATYAGTFFTMPAETTLMIGKTFITDDSNSNLDFGMGFDVMLFPNVFKQYVHWITDFSNFSYGVEAWPFLSSSGRGEFNTGLRIDLGALPSLSKFKFTIDMLGKDLFDSTRAFSVGLVFGASIL